MAEDDGFPFGGFGDDGGDDTTASGSAPVASVSVVISDTRVRCAYGFCRLACDDEAALLRHQSAKGHFVCMECAKPKKRAGAASSPAAAASGGSEQEAKLVATRAFQSQRLLDLHLATMHGIGTAVSTTSRAGSGAVSWSLNDLCDDLLLRMFSFLDLEPLSVAEAVCSHWRMTVASPSGQEQWQFLANWMVVLMDTTKRPAGGSSSAVAKNKPTWAAGKQKDDGGDNTTDEKDGKGKGKGKNKDKGRGSGRDKSDTTSGTASRTGAVATNEAKRPPKWKIIVAQKYKSFLGLVWSHHDSPIAAHILHAATVDRKWDINLTRRLCRDPLSLTRRYLIQFSPLHWAVYLDAPAADFKLMLESSSNINRVLGVRTGVEYGVEEMNVLHMAVWYNRLDIVRTICELTPDIKTASFFTDPTSPHHNRPVAQSSVHLAIARSMDYPALPMLQLLHQYGANLNYRPPHAPAFENETSRASPPLSPLELACVVREDWARSYRQIESPGTNINYGGNRWNWVNMTGSWSCASDRNILFPVGVPTGSIVTSDEDQPPPDHRKWNLSIIQWLIANGADDTGWMRSQAAGYSAPFSLNPLVLSCSGEHPLHAELFKFWLPRILAQVHLPTRVIDFESLPALLIAHLARRQYQFDASELIAAHEILQMLLDSGLCGINSKPFDHSNQPLTSLIQLVHALRGSAGAVYRAYIALVRFMLDRGARIDSPNERVHTLQRVFADLQLAQMILGNASVGFSLSHTWVLEGDRLKRAEARYLALHKRRLAIAAAERDELLRTLPSHVTKTEPHAATASTAAEHDEKKTPSSSSSSLVTTVSAAVRLLPGYTRPLTLAELREGYNRMVEILQYEQQDDDEDEKEQWQLRLDAWNQARTAAAAVVTPRLSGESKSAKPVAAAATAASSDSKGDSKVKSSSSSSSSGESKAEVKAGEGEAEPVEPEPVRIPPELHRPRRTNWLHYAAQDCSLECWHWLLHEVQVDPGWRSPSNDDEDHGTFSAEDHSVLLILLDSEGRADIRDDAHRPIWSLEEYRANKVLLNEAKAVLAKKATPNTVAERTAAKLVEQQFGRLIIDDSRGRLSKLDLLLRHPRFDAHSCNAAGQTDIDFLESKLRNAWSSLPAATIQMRVERSPLLQMLHARANGVAVPRSFRFHSSTRHVINRAAYRDAVTGEWVPIPEEPFEEP